MMVATLHLWEWWQPAINVVAAFGVGYVSLERCHIGWAAGVFIPSNQSERCIAQLTEQDGLAAHAAGALRVHLVSACQKRNIDAGKQLNRPEP
ncbi:hypothetical protein [Streptomyces cadmiisoli]|uniref:hypothetical protein n=1 Tax=Streptomyces cadmiisoli TaxID=2184053 RepID=UPI0036578379